MLLIKHCCYVGRKYMYQLKYQWRVNYITNNSDNRFSCHKSPRICSTCRKYFLVLTPHSWLITGFVTRLTRRVPLVEQELFTIPEHTSSPPVFSGVRDTRSLVICVCFVDRCLSFCTFSFGHCVVCSSLIYGI